MLGAIIGDIAGSIYEFNNVKTEAFPFLGPGCSYTDDSICTVAIAEAAMSDMDYCRHLQSWCRKYPNPMGGYGGNFAQWIHSDNPEPYGSYGNGAPMWVPSIGWLFESEAETERQARASAAITHNHQYGLFAAELIATAIFRLRNGFPKETAAKNIEKVFGWLPEYSPFSNPFDETSMNAVPVAVSCFLASNGFEDAVRKSIIVGGDSDSIGAITGALAEAYYGIPEDIGQKALALLPQDMISVYNLFNQRRYGN